MTKSEKWKKRAWVKYKMTGIYPLTGLTNYVGIITESEKEILKDMSNLQKRLLESFNENSKLLGFNIAEHRCWCGKVAIHKPDYEVYHENGNGLVCKKHIKKESCV